MGKKVTEQERAGFKKVSMKIDDLLETAESVLEGAMIDAPSHSDFQQNQEITYKWILDTQKVLTGVAHMRTRVCIEDRRLLELNDSLRKKFGHLNSEPLTKRVQFYIKNLRDMAAMLKETKDDLAQVITSVRSVQSAITSRLRVAGGFTG